MPKKIIFLQDWKASLPERLWIYIKIILKEGFWHWQWDQLLRLSRPFGSLRITQDLMQALEKENVTLLSKEDRIESATPAVIFKDVRHIYWALQEKKAGRISQLLAGPFVATMPFEYNSILLDPNIDGLIFLSAWHRDLFLKEASRPPKATYIWYAGVDTKKWAPSTEAIRKNILIFVKQVPDEKIKYVIHELERRNLAYHLIRYGSYTTTEYYAALNQAQFVIFLHMTETQGLATFEAWSMNRPTLHWNPGKMPFLGKSYLRASSCPYLSDQNGLDFKDWDTFPAKLDQMLRCWSNLNPRKEILEKYTWDHSVKIFKDIFKESYKTRQDQPCAE